jgi:SAM-dependent methyltransferase
MNSQSGPRNCDQYSRSSMGTQTEDRAVPITANSAETVGNEVILANQEFYKQIASKYDNYEACTSDTCFQRWLEDDLDIVERKLPERGEAVHCLDCGGGTGNVTLKMLRRGWRVTVVISFSSVLHHLHSPFAAVKKAAGKISPQGFFYSIFDPVSPSSAPAANCFNAIDTLIAKLLHDRADFFPRLARRFRKLGAPRDIAHNRAVISAGDLAEYQTHEGIDDAAIEDTLVRAGFTVDLKRYLVGRTALMRSANRHLRLVLNFKTLAQRAHEPSQ